MAYCPKCGSFVADGAVCSCQQNQSQQSWPQPQNQYGGQSQSPYGGQSPYGQPQSQYGAPPQNQYGGQSQQNMYGGQPQNQFGGGQQGMYGGGQQGMYGGPPYQQSQYGGAQYGMKPPGKTMIRVAGIIMTIFGAIGLAGAVISVLGAEALVNFIGDGFAYLMYYEVLTAVLLLVIGIFGILWAPRKDKAGVILIFGIIYIVLRLIDLVWGIMIAGEYLEVAAYVGVILGCVLPVLYIVGGNMRKNAPF